MLGDFGTRQPLMPKLHCREALADAAESQEEQ